MLWCFNSPKLCDSSSQTPGVMRVIWNFISSSAHSQIISCIWDWILASFLILGLDFMELQYFSFSLDLAMKDSLSSSLPPPQILGSTVLPFFCNILVSILLWEALCQFLLLALGHFPQLPAATVHFYYSSLCNVFACFNFHKFHFLNPCCFIWIYNTFKPLIPMAKWYINLSWKLKSSVYKSQACFEITGHH